MWLEEAYKEKFIDSIMKRNKVNGKDLVADGDYENYHRVSKVFWLTYIA